MINVEILFEIVVFRAEIRTLRLTEYKSGISRIQLILYTVEAFVTGVCR
jgi:hypothetical protein